MINLIKIIVYLILFLQLLSCNTSKVVVRKALVKEIDQLIEQENPRPFNGVVLMSEQGKTIYKKAHGFSDVGKKTALKIEDHFSSMSIAKQFTAVLILKEVEKGTICLNAPLSAYLKNLPFKWKDKVTVHQLLNNSSGIDSWELKEDLIFEPGTQFKYSNVGYATLGHILESVTGKSYEELVTGLFQDHRLKNTYYPSKSNSDKLLMSYFVSKENNKYNLVKDFPYSEEFFPGSHLIITAGDLAIWNEQLHNGKILDAESYQMMINYSISNMHPLFSENEIGYGYGLRINDKEGIFEIGHTGFSPPAGFTAVNLYYPKRKISVSILENIATDNFDIAYYYEEKIRNIIVKSDLVK